MKLYRYERVYDSYLGIYYLECTEYEVVSETRCGFWIGSKHSRNTKERFILSGKGRRWAHQEKEWALDSFIYRKRKRVMYLERDLRIETAILKQAKEIKEGLEITPIEIRIRNLQF